MFFSKSLHNVLNTIHKYVQKGKTFNLDDIFNKTFHLRYASEEQEADAKQTARIIINKYLENYTKDLELSLETEKPFEIALQNSLISGQIDLIRKHTTLGEEVIIVDFKTEKEPDHFRLAKHRDQILLYCLAFQKSFNEKPEKLFIHYLDKESERVEVSSSEKEIDQLIRKIDESIQSIKKEMFPRNPNSPQRCKNCDFKLICKDVK